MPKPRYNCERCPAYCCSYAFIHVTKRDLQRIAKHLGLSEAEVHKLHTKRGQSQGRTALRHKNDPHFGSVCRFLDGETRACRIYEARPAICRSFPATARCGYYDFLTFERRTQGDPDWIATTS